MWVREIREEEEEWAKQLRRRIWLLRATVWASLLPFDHPDLAITQQLRRLKSEANGLPVLRKSLPQLEDAISRLLAHPDNPKRERVFGHLKTIPGQSQWSSTTNGVIGLVTTNTRAPLPGWGDALFADIKAIVPNCELIPTRKYLLARTFDSIILPSGGRYCPFQYQLYHSARSATLIVVAYQSEGVIVPDRLILPLSSLPPRAASWRVPEVRSEQPRDAPQVVPADEAEELPAWVGQRGESVVLSGHKRHFLVRARLLVLNNRTKLFLRDDLSVIELSDYTDGRMPLDEGSFSSHRIEAKDIQDGDVLFLRTSGSGEYLGDVASSLMQADGKHDLRVSALDWKPALREALERFGAEEIYARLAKKGFAPESPPRYLWQWTTANVIRPQSSSTFYELIGILADLGMMPHEPVSVADTRWQLMDEIIRYNHRAGMVIRRALLSRLRELLDEGLRIEDSYVLTLPNLDAGTFSLFRVASVFPEAVEVPDTLLDVPVSIED